MMRLILAGLLTLSISCTSKEVGRSPPSGDTRIPADSSGGGGDTATGDTGAGDPVTGDPMTGDPMTGDPMTGDPMTGDPMAGDPMTGDPMTGDPMTGDPMTGDPMTGDSMTGDPFVGDPIAPGDFANCTADGPHVSSTTCLVSNQCGTVERPWCTIQGGIDNAAAGPILVAGVSGRPYAEAITMADGVDVDGGWDTGFSARSTDPLTNGSVIQLANTITWPANASATLDGFLINNSAISIGDDVTAITADSTAGVTLSNVAMRLTGTVTSVIGVSVAGAGAGTLTMDTCDIEIADATSFGIGVLTRAGFAGTMTLTDTSVTAGAAPATAAVRIAGSSSVTITNGSYYGGDATANSRGVHVQGAAEIAFTDVTVHGGTGATAVGIDVERGADLVIEGGDITGGGALSSDSSSAAIGVRSSSATQIDGVGITGADPDSFGAGILGSGTGVEITGNPASIVPVTVSNATIEGGHLALARTGVGVANAVLDLQSSSVSGSTSNGGITTLGVHLTGNAASGNHNITNNPSIIGGAADSGNLGVYFSIGVYANTGIPTVVSGNTLIQACAPACNGPGISANNVSSATGVYFAAGTSHSLDNNLTVLGGPHTGTNTSTIHSGVAVGFLNGISVAGPIEVDITGNGLISGNEDASQRPANALGAYGRDVDLLIDSNPDIRGGYATDTATGIAILQRTPPTLSNIAAISSNGIFGGAATHGTGAVVRGTVLSVTDNVIDACGIPSSNPGPAPDCVSAAFSDGLVVQFNPIALIANNFVFGGYAISSDGCVISAPDVSDGGRTLMVYNLCLGISHTSPGNLTRSEGLTIEGGTQAGFLVFNNLIGAGTSALNRYGVREGTVTGITFEYNDILPDSTGDVGVALYLLEDGTELDVIADVNGITGPNLTYANNLSTDPGFDAPDINAPTAADFHLSSTCLLRNLGQPGVGIDLDYDGDTRDDGSSARPEIGPDECPPP